MSIVQPSYFSPIAQYAAIIRSEEIVFEIADNFQKQTYRNRCYICSPNGKQLLNIPIKRFPNGKQKTKDVLIDYDTDNWQKNHLKSFQATYRSSPFFEFYEDELLAIFGKKHKFLLDLNLDTHFFVMDALQEEKKYSMTKSFQLTTKEDDFRCLANAKLKFDLKLPTYTQMFDEKHGFIENLSILDLLFMMGPSAEIYLQKSSIALPNFPVFMK
jgi:hypothetical protein